MANETKNDLNTETLLEEAKEIGVLAKEKKYFQLTKKVFHLFSSAYNKSLKGKYVEIKGKKIPMVLVVVAALGLGWTAIPSGSETTAEDSIADENQSDELKEKEELNSYNKDGIKVYGMYKCDNAVCGYLENDTDNDVARILISVTFHDKTGAVVYEGGAEATAMVAKSRSRFKILADGEFEYFRLTDVTVEKDSAE